MSAGGVSTRRRLAGRGCRAARKSKRFATGTVAAGGSQLSGHTGQRGWGHQTARTPQRAAKGGTKRKLKCSWEWKRYAFGISSQSSSPSALPEVANECGIYAGGQEKALPCPLLAHIQHSLIRP